MHRTYSEFGLIEQIAARFAELTPSGIEGIGDDCAIFSMNDTGSKEHEGGMVNCITTDMLVENVHFTREINPFDLGVRSVEVNLSDVASMGAEPLALLCSIALPDWVDEEWTAQFFEGIHSRGVALIGGDTTRSRGGLCINITAIGRAPKPNIKRRNAAKVGDRVMVAGMIGSSAASAYTAPVKAQTDEGIWLGARAEVGAMMDLSDGLAGDLPHILRASGVGATIEIDALPIAASATLEQALSGGEDYKLLLTACSARADQLQKDFFDHFGTPLYNIGEIITSSSLQYTQRGEHIDLKFSGFRHF